MVTYNDIQRREIFHFLFLEELLRISNAKLYVVKGGVNLRFFFRSPRYSEDMDLDVLAGNVATLKTNGYKILESAPFKRSLQTYGINSLEINEPNKGKHTEITQRFRLRLITEAGESLPTKVEFSRRGSDELPYSLEKTDPAIANPYQRLAFRCQHYTGETAAIQKVLALAGRTVTQARDVFDLNILHAGGFVKPGPIVKHLKKEVLKKAIDQLHSLGFDEYNGQVVEFLDENARARYETRDAWADMKKTILKVLTHEK